MENTPRGNDWLNVIKNWNKSPDINSWPSLDEETKDMKTAETLDSGVGLFINDIEEDPNYPSLNQHYTHKKQQKMHKLSQKWSDELLDAKYSNKVKKRITKSTNLGAFLNRNPKKVVKNLHVENLMQKLKDDQIVFYKGRKREIPRRKMTRLKKSIMRIRAEKQNEHPDSSHDNPKSEVNPDVIESIRKLKLDENVIRHSRQFRPYCTNLTSTLLCELTENLLVQLRNFQQKQHQKNPERYKKRYITGINEVRKFLDAKKVKLLIIAPDLEPNSGPGGLDETVEKLKSICVENHIPVVFSLKRRKLGYVLLKKIPVSCVGILSYEGCQELHGKLIDELLEQIGQYKNSVIS